MTRLVEEVAATVVTPRFRSLDDDEVHEKNPGDLVTVADHEAEALLTKALLDGYPDAVVLGEEAHSQDRSVLDRYRAAAHAFTVDPLDGTKNFVRGSPDHAVMVSESRDGHVVRGWIHQPQHGLSYVVERGAGAYRNGERLHRTAPPADRARWRGVTSRRAWVGRSLPGLPPLELSWVCCGVDYPQLVEGAADLVLYGRAQPWDHAAGSLLVVEAGGHVGTADGLDYAPQAPVPAGLVVAADRAAYDVVRALL